MNQKLIDGTFSLRTAYLDMPDSELIAMRLVDVNFDAEQQ